MRGLKILKIRNGSSEMSKAAASRLVTAVGFGDDLDSLSCLDFSGCTAFAPDIASKNDQAFSLYESSTQQLLLVLLENRFGKVAFDKIPTSPVARLGVLFRISRAGPFCWEKTYQNLGG